MCQKLYDVGVCSVLRSTDFQNKNLKIKLCFIILRMPSPAMISYDKMKYNESLDIIKSTNLNGIIHLICNIIYMSVLFIL